MQTLSPKAKHLTYLAVLTYHRSHVAAKIADQQGKLDGTSLREHRRLLQLAISNMQRAISDHGEPFNHREDMYLSRERAESMLQQWQQEITGLPLGQRVPKNNQELATASGRPPLLTTTGKQ
jgi:hypothetical protein